MLYEFELGHNTEEATKNICWAKDDHSTVTKCLKKFRVSRTSTIRQSQVGQKPWISRLCSIEANPSSKIIRVSNVLGISQSSVFRHLHNLVKSIWNQNMAKLLTHPSISSQNLSTYFWCFYKQRTLLILMHFIFR